MDMREKEMTANKIEQSPAENIIGEIPSTIQSQVIEQTS